MNENGEIVTDRGGENILQSLKLYVLKDVKKYVSSICSNDPELFKQYKNGDLFNNTFIKRLISVIDGDPTLTIELSKETKKQNIMSECGMSEDEYKITVLREGVDEFYVEQNNHSINPFGSPR